MTCPLARTSFVHERKKMIAPYEFPLFCMNLYFFHILFLLYERLHLSYAIVFTLSYILTTTYDRVYIILFSLCPWNLLAQSLSAPTQAGNSPSTI